MRANPLRLISDFYLSRSERVTATLLDNVNFKLLAGQRLGIIGENGAGKSTLLRVIAGIYQPSSGRLVVCGKAKGLFDISLGMQPEATGLENIYMRGLQMVMSLRSVRKCFLRIFGNYLSTSTIRFLPIQPGCDCEFPTMIEPDILLLDEWIGAGDAAL